jgi:hypothetical protein
VQLAHLIASSPVLRADQDPGGSSVGGGGVYVFVVGVIVAVLLSLLLFFGLGQLRDRKARREFARDLEQGFALLERQLDGLASHGNRAADEARNRLTAARALMEHGAGLPVLRAVRHTLLEGLAAAHFARRAAGLDAGAVPPPPNEAPLTDSPVTVEVRGTAHTGLPHYAPGSVHHFPGGILDGVEVPGGWYADAFWEAVLLDPQRPAPAAGPAPSTPETAAPKAAAPETAAPETAALATPTSVVPAPEIPAPAFPTDAASAPQARTPETPAGGAPAPEAHESTASAPNAQTPAESTPPA